MKSRIYAVLVWIALLSACTTPSLPQPTPSEEQSPSITKTIPSNPTPIPGASALPATTAPPSPMPTETFYPEHTLLPSAEETLATLRPTVQPAPSYCELLAKDYQPPEGFTTYCDPDYDFAFDYPADWDTTLVAQSPERPDAPQLVRRAQRFSAPDMSNFVRTDTFRLVIPLPDKVKVFWGYAGSEFPEKEYPDLKIGGQRAYATINRWQQDISAVYLFFQHAEYYTIIELKAPSRAALDFNWKIAASIQVPGVSPQDNQIPAELISDSYTLTDPK